MNSEVTKYNSELEKEINNSDSSELAGILRNHWEFWRPFGSGDRLSLSIARDASERIFSRVFFGSLFAAKYLATIYTVKQTIECVVYLLSETNSVSP